MPAELIYLIDLARSFSAEARAELALWVSLPGAASASYFALPLLAPLPARA